MTSDLLSETMEAKRKQDIFSGTERKELSIQNPIHSENTLQE